MSYLPKTKIFNGQRYKLHNDYLRQGDAEWAAAKLRSGNWRVRVVRMLGLYGVYKRRT